MARHKGFSLLEVLFQCPTYYGRFNGTTSAAEMLNEFKEFAVRYRPGRDKPLSDGRFYIGELFSSSEREEFCECYERIREEMSRRRRG